MGQHRLFCWLSEVGGLGNRARFEKKERLLMNQLHSNMLPFQNAAYAPTKTVVHWLTKAISIEEPWLTAFPIDPGYDNFHESHHLFIFFWVICANIYCSWVQTDLGNRGAKAVGFKEAAITLEESVSGLVKTIDAATKETYSGKLWTYTGEEVLAW